MKNKFLVLWLAGILGAVSVLPYAFTLQNDIIVASGQPLSLLIFAAIAQTAILLSIAIFFGLKLSRSLNLPVLTIFDSNNISVKKRWSRFFLLTISIGIVTAVLIAFGDMLFGQYMPQLIGVNGQVATWKTLFASLYGGIVEEILMRLFAMSLIVWIIAKISKSTEPAKNSIIMWTAIVISSILFSIGHLPITSALTEITPLVVTRAIVLNSIGGIAFGYLYWKKGLEYSMMSHLTADIVLLSIIPTFLM
ncbi:MAG: CPBP family glutamic-type intramembrane protease [Bacilli bacterium]|nr:CPBP family glutamic-type intramembrane protease [Bacilli bacterium]